MSTLTVCDVPVHGTAAEWSSPDAWPVLERVFDGHCRRRGAARAGALTVTAMRYLPEPDNCLLLELTAPVNGSLDMFPGIAL